MAFFQDPARQPFLRVPPVAIWLIAILIGLHAMRVWLFSQNANETNYILHTYGFWPAGYSPSYLLEKGGNPRDFFHQAFPFVTYIFLHGSWTHVLINSAGLLAFGPVVARRFGSLLFLLFFFVCGAAGAATHLAVYWGSPSEVIGASAAVSGLMAASFRMLPLSPRQPDPVPLVPILSSRILLWTAIWALINVVAGVTGLGAGPGPNVIAWVAHMGGYFTGLLLTGPFEALAKR